MIGVDPAGLVDHAFDTWASDPNAIDGEHRAAYRQAITPETVAAMCADYRASFYLDRFDDAADRKAGRRIAVPVLVVTGQSEVQLADASEVWSGWADGLVTAQVPGGHFVPEEAPQELTAVLVGFLQSSERR